MRSSLTSVRGAMPMVRNVPWGAACAPGRAREPPWRIGSAIGHPLFARRVVKHVPNDGSGVAAVSRDHAAGTCDVPRGSLKQGSQGCDDPARSSDVPRGSSKDPREPSDDPAGSCDVIALAIDDPAGSCDVIALAIDDPAGSCDVIALAID